MEGDLSLLAQENNENKKIDKIKYFRIFLNINNSLRIF
jgi:hypothetical protein